VEARFTASTVEVIFKSKRVAAHARLRGRGHHATKPEHMPRSHRAHAEWTPSRLIGWADKAGPATGRVVAEILRSRPHPEQGYRSCLGILRLGQRLGEDRLDQACLRAELLDSYSYQTVKNILKAGLDKLPLEPDAVKTALPSEHHNIRGAAYYAAEETEC
jgi:transposase